MEVTVKGSRSKEDARKIARSVVSSSLFKAAIFGEAANWGRVLCAMGYSGGVFDPFGVNMSFASEEATVKLMENGSPLDFDEALASKILAMEDIFVNIELSEGAFSATAWGCDLTYDYVKINGSYRS
jgi:glutamate N-acetyltransferase/amino-acid N-acetyltransferase